MCSMNQRADRKSRLTSVWGTWYRRSHLGVCSKILDSLNRTFICIPWQRALCLALGKHRLIIVSAFQRCTLRLREAKGCLGLHSQDAAELGVNLNILRQGCSKVPALGARHTKMDRMQVVRCRSSCSLHIESRYRVGRHHGDYLAQLPFIVEKQTMTYGAPCLVFGSV